MPYRFNDLDLHSKLSAAFERAHTSEFGHNAIETQRQAHRCMRKLVLCLQELNLNHCVPLPASIALDVHKWLAESGLAGSTAQSHQAIILTALKWCYRNVAGIVHKNANFEVPSFSRQTPKRRPELEPSLMKKVLAACYDEICEVEARLATGKRLVSGGAVGDEEFKLASTIVDLIAAGGGFPARQTLTGRAGRDLSRRVNAAGGHNAIRMSLYVTPEAVFPFYLAVLIQCAGNPISMRLAEVDDAIEPHPLRDDLETLNWGKARARHEQRVDFPKGKEWSAPNLVRRLLILNEPLRKLSSAGDRNKVFLAIGTKAPSPSVPCVQLLHTMLEKFIERHGFPNFDFKDWRPTVARAHHRAGGTIATPQARLNHRSATTTVPYVGTEHVAGQSDRVILRFQGELVRGSKAAKVPTNKDRPTRTTAPPSVADTVFGFRCKDPFGGLDGETSVGSTCMNFSRCSTCKGALVPLDDVKVVARLLASMAALESARLRATKEGWWPRFKVLYEPTRLVIAKELLPAVAPTVLVIAKKLVEPRLVPFLE